MKTPNTKAGFTLAELLIVVAIIAVLVAIAIPVFTTQLEKAREATDIANVRSGYAAAITQYLAEPVAKKIEVKVPSTQTIDEWQSGDPKLSTNIGSGSNTFAEEVSITCHTNGDPYVVTISAEGKVSVE